MCFCKARNTREPRAVYQNKAYEIRRNTGFALLCDFFVRVWYRTPRVAITDFKVCSAAGLGLGFYYMLARRRRPVKLLTTGNWALWETLPLAMKKEEYPNKSVQ